MAPYELHHFYPVSKGKQFGIGTYSAAAQSKIHSTIARKKEITVESSLFIIWHFDEWSTSIPYQFFELSYYIINKLMFGLLRLFHGLNVLMASQSHNECNNKYNTDVKSTSQYFKIFHKRFFL